MNVLGFEWAGFFEGPVENAVRVAVAVSGEKAAAMLPEPGPDSLAVGLGQIQARQLAAREELEPAFAMDSRQSRKLWGDLK